MSHTSGKGAEIKPNLSHLAYLPIEAALVVGLSETYKPRHDVEAVTVELGANRSRLPFSAHKTKALGFVGASFGMQGALDEQSPLPGGGLEGRDFPDAASGQSRRDSYRVGFIWSVVKDDDIGNDGVGESDIWDDGLAWTTDQAESDAIAAITAIRQQPHA